MQVWRNALSALVDSRKSAMHDAALFIRDEIGREMKTKAGHRAYASVWDAIEDTPAAAANMKLRSALMMALFRHIEREKLTQKEIGRASCRERVCQSV